MPAASAADAFVLVNTSEKCSTAPAPLLAITGILTASEINLIKSISNPFPWPEIFTVEKNKLEYKHDLYIILPKIYYQIIPKTKISFEKWKTKYNKE